MGAENTICDDKMTVEECEMIILRNSVDETEKIQKTKIANTDDVKKMISILEDFLKKSKAICYGGTAINNILPEEAQFYDKSVEIPDYDFFIMDAAKKAKELADIYYAAGFEETEAKSGVHKGTYKVFVNYIPMADLTELNPDIFRAIQKDSIVINGIHYAPPNYLRMGMFLELSRPAGDVSRWEKVFKRLTLLNKYYPMKAPYNCRKVEMVSNREKISKKMETVFFTLRDALTSQKVVFFGGYAASLYLKYTKKGKSVGLPRIPDFDVISENPDKCAQIVKERLADQGIKSVKIVNHANLDDVVPEHIQILVDGVSVAFIFKPIACYNYNIAEFGSHRVMVATIDTMLSFYLAFAYSNQTYFDVERILCMAQFLFDLEQRNRVSSKGLLKRFSANCYGEQHTLSTLRAEKTEKFREFKEKGVKRDSQEWNQWFFKYSPAPESTESLSSVVAKKKSIKNKSDVQPKRRNRTQRRRPFSLFGRRRTNRNIFF